MILAITSKWSIVTMACMPKPQRTPRGQHHHHGEAGIHGADDEIRREDRLLPARHQARGEVEADDAVQRHHQRHRERGHRHVIGLVIVPMPRRAAPAEREGAVDGALDRSGCSVAHASRGRGSARHTRRLARTGCSSGSPRNPRSAPSATAATDASCWGRASASRNRAAGRDG